MAVKWGVIGAGGIADRRTIPDGIMPSKIAELTAVMDIEEARTKAVAAKYGNVKYFTKEEDLIKDPNVEAVYIGTPTHLHCGQTIMAAKAKKHVLCEKPMGMNAKECEQMIEACEKNGVKLAIGYMMRFHAHHQQLREMIQAGKLGQIVMGRAQLSCWYPPIPGAWRQILKLGGGGALVDMGSHCIDLLEMLIGKTAEVCCFTGNLVHKYESEDCASVLINFENGAKGYVDSYFNIPDASSKNILEIYGTLGSALGRGTVGQMPNGEMTAYLEKEMKGYDAKQVRAEGSVELNIAPQPVGIYQAEIDDLSQCIQGNRKPQIPGERGLWNVKILEACYKSAKTGKVVKVS